MRIYTRRPRAMHIYAIPSQNNYYLYQHLNVDPSLSLSLSFFLHIDRWWMTDGQMSRMDRQIDGWMNVWIDGQTMTYHGRIYLEYIYIYIYRERSLSLYLSLYIYIYIYTGCVCVSLSIYIYIHAHLSIYLSISLSLYIYIYVCVCVYIYIYRQINKQMDR